MDARRCSCGASAPRRIHPRVLYYVVSYVDEGSPPTVSVEFRFHSDAAEMTRKRWRPIAAAAVATWLLAACGGTADGTQSVDTVAAVPAVNGTQPAALEAVFVPTSDGGQLDFNSLRGTDLVLWFWAPW